jgi:hypothetical protein
MKRLDEIFDIWYGVNLELVNCEEIEGGIPFVSRQSVNNGISGYVKDVYIDPNPAHSLSIAGSGNVLSTFYHDYEYYSGRDVYIAKPNKTLTKEQMLFYAYVIEQNKYRYNYGRQANKTLKNILVPDIDELPDYLNTISVRDYDVNRVPAMDKTIELNVNDWGWLFLRDLFNVERGKRLTKADRGKGKIPLVTAGFRNEGIADFISSEEMKCYQNALTIDMFGNCFYRGYDFFCDDNILVLMNDRLTIPIGIFIATIINNDKYKFQYGRQYRQKFLRRHKIKLPIRTNGSPDWQWMEDYIKTLPYSRAI